MDTLSLQWLLSEDGNPPTCLDFHCVWVMVLLLCPVCSPLGVTLGALASPYCSAPRRRVCVGVEHPQAEH